MNKKFTKKKILLTFFVLLSVTFIIFASKNLKHIGDIVTLFNYQRSFYQKEASGIKLGIDTFETYEPEEIEGWQTYNHKERGFSIRHPKELYIKEEAETPKDTIFSTKPFDESFDAENIVQTTYRDSDASVLRISYSLPYDNSDFELDIRKRFSHPQELVKREINGMEVISTKSSEATALGTGNIVKNYHYIRAKNGNVFSFTFQVGSEDLGSVKIFYTMLSTFKQF
jgi:hypothetical protein